VGCCVGASYSEKPAASIFSIVHSFWATWRWRQPVYTVSWHSRPEFSTSSKCASDYFYFECVQIHILPFCAELCFSSYLYARYGKSRDCLRHFIVPFETMACL